MDRFCIKRIDLKQEQQYAIDTIKLHAQKLEKQLDKYGIPSRELSIAMTKLEESVMWAVKSVIQKEKQP